MGIYDSFNRDVMRMHAIWLAQMGIDLILIDWTNNIWDLDDWNHLGPGPKEIINATFITLDYYTELEVKKHHLIFFFEMVEKKIQIFSKKDLFQYLNFFY